MSQDAVAIFSLLSGRSLAARVAAHLGTALAAHEEREFEWGHHKSRPLESVRGRDVYVVTSLHGDAAQNVNDKLCRLLFFLGAIRDADPGRLTAVVPFLCYSRKDRRTKPRDPVTTRYVAAMFEAVGVDRVATVEVHNLAAYENAFRCRSDHIEAGPYIAEVLARELQGRSLVVVSPDQGGLTRAELFRDALSRRLGREIGSACVEKHRSGDVLTGQAVVGEVAGHTAVLVDDLISGGTTLARAAAACMTRGATAVVAAAAHGAFVPEASATLAAAPIERFFVLDHIPPDALDPALVAGRVRAIDSSRLIADAVRGMHGAGPD